MRFLYIGLKYPDIGLNQTIKVPLNGIRQENQLSLFWLII